MLPDIQPGGGVNKEIACPSARLAMLSRTVPLGAHPSDANYPILKPDPPKQMPRKQAPGKLQTPKQAQTPRTRATDTLSDPLQHK